MAIIDKVIDLKNKGLSVRQIEAELKDTEFKVSKSVAGEIIKENNKKK